MSFKKIDAIFNGFDANGVPQEILFKTLNFEWNRLFNEI